MKRKIHAVAGYPPAPGQTVTNGSFDPNAASAQIPKLTSQPSSPGQAAVNDFRAKIKAAGGYTGGACSGMDQALMDHADKMHPVGRRG